MPSNCQIYFLLCLMFLTVPPQKVISFRKHFIQSKSLNCPKLLLMFTIFRMEVSVIGKVVNSLLHFNPSTSTPLKWITKIQVFFLVSALGYIGVRHWNNPPISCMDHGGNMREDMVNKHCLHKGIMTLW